MMDSPDFILPSCSSVPPAGLTPGCAVHAQAGELRVSALLDNPHGKRYYQRDNRRIALISPVEGEEKQCIMTTDRRACAPG